MSHVDDGELTAYADGAYPVDDPVALRISAHLSTCGDCRTRLEQDQDLRTRAAQILSYATPVTVTTPSFESLQTQVAAATRKSRPGIPIAWAATIMLALGLGWFGRDAWDQPGLTRTAAAPEVAPTPTQEQEADVPITVPFAPPVAAPSVARQRARMPPSAAVREPQLAEGGAGVAADMAAGAARVAAADAPPLAAANEAVVTSPTLTAQAGVEYITPAEAEQRGLQIPRIPELPIARIGLSASGTTVDHTLPDGKLVTLNIGPENTEVAKRGAEKVAAAAAPPAAPQPQRMEAAAAGQVIGTRRDQRVITISGEVSADSLRVLLGKVR